MGAIGLLIGLGMAAPDLVVLMSTKTGEVQGLLQRLVMHLLQL